MFIETKYDVGQDVFFLSKGKIVNAPVKHICLKADDEGVKIHYHFEKINGEKKTLRTEDYLFETKDELLDSL